jgi:hypothetical protein
VIDLLGKVVAFAFAAGFAAFPIYLMFFWNGGTR